MSINQEKERQMKNLCRLMKQKSTEQALSLDDLSQQTMIPIYLLKEIEEEDLTDCFTVEMLFTLCCHFHLRIGEYFKPLGK